MAADLHIHVQTKEITEDILRVFKGPLMIGGPEDNSNNWDNAYRIISQSPNVWIGEVSWLKAGLLGDSDEFIPSTVQQVYDLIGDELPELTDDLIKKILKTFNSKNNTGYELAESEEVEKFLLKHKGNKVFTVSW